MLKDNGSLTFSDPLGIPVESLKVNFITAVNDTEIVIGPIEIKACKKPGESANEPWHEISNNVEF